MRSINKSIFPLTMLLVFVGYNSCDESRLDLKPQSPTEDSYFSEEVEFERMVTGIYAKLTDFYWYNTGANNCVQPVHCFPGMILRPMVKMNLKFFQTFNLEVGDWDTSFLQRTR